MIKFKVKTLDGHEHAFEVSDETTLSQFRPMLAEKTTIPANRQRLIFHGRVLQNEDDTLKALGVDGKALHVVERAPNAAPNTPRGQGTRQRFEQAAQGMPQYVSRNLTQPQIEGLVRRALERLVGVQHVMTTRRRGNILDVRIQFRPRTLRQVDSPARSRVQHIKHVLRHVRHILYHLEQDPLTELNVSEDNGIEHAPTRSVISSENPPSHPDDQVDLGFHPLVGDCRDRSHEQPLENRPTPRAESPEVLPDVNENDNDNRLRVHHAMATELAELFDEVMQIETRLRPQMLRFRRLIARDPDFTDNISLGRMAARFVNGVQVALHNVSHIYHALSDLSIHFCEPPPRRLYPQYSRTEGNPPQGEAEVTLTIGSDGMATQQAAAESLREQVQGVHFPQPRPPAPRTQPPRAPFPLPNMGRMLGNVQTQGARIHMGPGGQLRITDPQGRPMTQNDLLGPMMQNIRQAFGALGARQAVPGAEQPQRIRIPIAVPLNPPQQNAPPQGPPPAAPQAGGGAAAADQPARRTTGHPLGAIHLNDENMEQALEQAVFVGPRPPSELPLFTLDPFLSCSSRHFDPRHLRRLRDTRARGINRDQPVQDTQAEETASSNTTANSESAADQSATGPQRYANDEPGNVIDDEEEFVDGLERMLRSVALNLNGSQTSSQTPAAQDDHDEQLYAFQPLSLVPPTHQPQPTLHGTLTLENAALQAAAGQANNGAGQEQISQDTQRLVGQVMTNLASGSQQTLAEFLRSFSGEGTPDQAPGFVGYMMRCLGECMSIPDLYALVLHDHTPFDRRRTQIRQHVVQNVMNDNSHPSDDDLQSASERIAANVDMLRQAFQITDEEWPLIVRDDQDRDIDLVASLVRCDRVHSQRVLAAVLRNATDPNDSRSFGQRLYDAAWTFLREYAFIVDLGSTPDRDLMRRLLTSANSESPPGFAMTDGLINMSLQQLRNMLSTGNHVVTFNHVRDHLVLANHNAQQDNSTEQTVPDQPTLTPTPPPVVTPQAPISNAASTSANQSGQSAAKEEQASPKPGDKQWTNALPADWASIIEADIKRQKNQRPQAPFSDSYMAGIPAKRRKLILEERESVSAGGGTAVEHVKHTLKEAIGRANVQPITGESNTDVLDSVSDQSALIDAHSTHVNNTINQRVNNDPDFEPDKFPKSTQCFTTADKP